MNHNFSSVVRLQKVTEYGQGFHNSPDFSRFEKRIPEEYSTRPGIGQGGRMNVVSSIQSCPHKGVNSRVHVAHYGDAAAEIWLNVVLGLRDFLAAATIRVR